MGSFWPRTAWAQSNLVPLGTAAQYSLLSGNTLTTDAASRVHALGMAGAGAGLVGPLTADSAIYHPGNQPAAVATALTGLANARAYCTALTGQQPLSLTASQTFSPGVYTYPTAAVLPGGTRWTLTGSAFDRFVFNFAADVTLAPDVYIVLDGVSPANVYWNVNGVFVSGTEAGLPGVLMANSINLSGVWSSLTAVLTTGSLTLTGLDALIGRTAFPSRSQLITYSQPAAAPMASVACANLLTNPSFETPETGIRWPRSRSNLHIPDMQCRLAGGDVGGWATANMASPDWFRRGAPLAPLNINQPNGLTTNLSIPVNDMGTADTRSSTDSSYIGIYCSNSLNSYREYAFQPMPVPLQSARRYYVEFYSRLASNSTLGAPDLGARFSTTCPYQTRSTTMLDASNAPLLPHISQHNGGFLGFNDVTQWVRTAGCYLATGGEQFLTLGYYNDVSGARLTSDDGTGTNTPIAGLGNGFSGAYYYLDEVTVSPFPQPVLTFTGNTDCLRRSYTLDFTCLLPASSGATYAWQVNGQTIATGTNPLVVTPLTTTTYTLVTTVPGLGTDPATVDQQPITITVPPVVVLAGTKTGGANYPAATYWVNGPLTFTQGTYTFAPGSVVRVNPETNITVGNGATLIAQATTFTAAHCSQMWAGLTVAATAKGLCLGRTGDNLSTALPATAGWGQQNPVSEISYARTAISWQSPPTTPVRVLHTRFWNNLNGLNAATGATATSAVVAAGSAVVNCLFDSNPAQFRSVNTDEYMHVAVNLDGWNYQNTRIAGNRFLRCVVGILLRTTTTASKVTIADRNEFGALMVGIKAMNPGAALTVSGNRFVYGYPSSYPLSAALMTRFNTAWPSVMTGLTNKVTGLYVYGSLTNTTGTLTVQANDFGLNSYPNNFPATWTYPQRGVVVDLINSPYLISDNTFSNLETGLRLGLQYGGNATSKVASNQFYNNNTGLALFRPSGPVPATTPVFWPQCNTFRRSNTGGANSVGIRVESGLAVVFDNWEKRTTPAPNFPAGRPWQEFMKNRFDDQSGTNQRMRYLANASTTAIVYTAYEDQDALVPYTINLKNELSLASRQTNFSISWAFNTQTGLTRQYTTAKSCTNQDGMNDGFNPTRGLGIGDSTTTPAQPYIGFASPNPVSSEARIRFLLPTEVKRAQVVVRDLESGKIVWQQAIASETTEILLSVKSLRNGVYPYSVIADEVVLGTRRLLVNHTD